MTTVTCTAAAAVAESCCMDRRFLVIFALVAAACAALGFAGLDRPLAEWVHSSGIESSRFFVWGLAALDTVTVLHLFIVPWIAIVAGALLLRGERRARLGMTLVTAGLVQLAAIQTMLLAKDHFGRLRPFKVFEQGNWSNLWFVGGDSFPSGHSAFYFGICLPLAAACPIRWLRWLLVAIPLYVVLARIDMAKHFLSDVSTSALMVAVYALVAAWLTARWLPPPARA
ncbi:MAG TPA: phosphatase PAP2 family protein [Rhodanobacteraceae bacterium]|nr:phosphatase PAP2 family protein [Rhodanobacteraceae bacterium]